MMSGEAAHGDSAAAQRVELILQEIESLPTLSSVAVRLLEVTADDDAEAAEVIALVSSDPALASKVLALCRSHDEGRASRVTTIDRAVLLLGFESLRWAVLSAHVFEVLDGMPSRAGEAAAAEPVFDREAFWMHSLGVATASERIIRNLPPSSREPDDGEAFTAGLLHDIGQLVLHVILPETFDRVCRVAETHGVPLDRACRHMIGLDTYTAGKRLVEHWGLPRSLVDVVWLSGQPYQALPAVAHRRLIAVVSLADAVVRQQYITPGTQPAAPDDLASLCAALDLNDACLQDIRSELHDDVARRAAALGMHVQNDAGVLLRSIIRANQVLARANAGLRQRDQWARRQARVLSAIELFHDSLTDHDSVTETLARIGHSAAAFLNVRPAAALYRAAEDGPWRLVRITSEARPYDSRVVALADDVERAVVLTAGNGIWPPATPVLPWLQQQLSEDRPEELRLFALAPEPGGSRALLVLRASLPPPKDAEEFGGLRQCWWTALKRAEQRQNSLEVTELLAEANRRMVAVQEELAERQALATVGEVAAGAAHEINNPLTVISGRAQLLATRLLEPTHRDMVLEIARQAHRVSDIVAALRAFAEPVEPNIRTVDLPELVMRIVQRYGPGERSQPDVSTVVGREQASVNLDPDLIGPALGELVRNAVESKGVKHIELRVQTDPLDGRLKLEVRDDGAGLSDHALRHAFDPFFSAKPAGRQPGLGLSCARRFVEAHGGRITLANGPHGGAVATIWLDQRTDEARRPRDRHAA